MRAHRDRRATRRDKRQKCPYPLDSCQWQREPHRVALLCLERVVAFDLSVPAEVFSLAWAQGRPLYELDGLRRPPRQRRDHHRLCDRRRRGARGGRRGRHGARPRLPRGPRPRRRSRCSRRCAPRPLAGRAWRRSAPAPSRSPTLGCSTAGAPRPTGSRPTELARRFPAVDVEPNALYVEDGRVLTSAGLSAGIDLCLHIVRSDHGERIGSRVARAMVAAPHRDGGQAQFIERRAARADRRRLARARARTGRSTTSTSRSTSPRSPPRRGQPAHLRPPLRRRDRDHAASVAQRPAGARGAAPARAHRPRRRAGRGAVGLRLGAVAARALPPRDGDTPTRTAARSRPDERTTTARTRIDARIPSLDLVRRDSHMPTGRRFALRPRPARSRASRRTRARESVICARPRRRGR